MNCVDSRAFGSSSDDFRLHSHRFLSVSYNRADVDDIISAFRGHFEAAVSSKIILFDDVFWAMLAPSGFLLYPFGSQNLTGVTET